MFGTNGVKKVGRDSVVAVKGVLYLYVWLIYMNNSTMIMIAGVGDRF